MGRRSTNTAMILAGSIGRQAINRRFFRRGTAWKLLFYISTARTIMRRIAGGDEEIVLSERLRPGRPLVVSAVSGAARKRERAAARAAGMSRRRARRI